MSKKNNIFYISGPKYQRDILIKKIKGSISKSYETSVYDENISWNFVKQSIMENSCFVENKLVIINEWPKTNKTRPVFLKDFISFLDKIPIDCCVIFNNLSIKSKKFFEKIEEIGHLHRHDNTCDRNEASKKIYKFFGVKQQVIEESAVPVIINSLCMENIIKIDSLVLRLIAINHYTGSKKNVTYKDVLSVCYNYENFVIWNFFNALDSKNHIEALLLFDLLKKYSSDMEHEIVMLLHSLMWRYKLFMIIKDRLDSNVRPGEISKEIAKIIKIDKKAETDKAKDVPAYSSKMVNFILQGIGRSNSPIDSYGIDDLFAINEVLISSLRKIRSGCANAEKEIIMRLIILLICNKIKNLSKCKVFTSKYFN
jgi:DNA polymerase III delta subunit